MKQVVLLLILTVSMLAEKPVTLRLEKKTGTDFLEKLADISDKKLELKCFINGDLYNFNYLNAPLKDVLKDACTTLQLYHSVAGDKIIIDDKPILQPDSKRFTVTSTERFKNSYERAGRNLEELFGSIIQGLTDLSVENGKLSFTADEKQVRTFRKALGILGYIKTERELRIKFALYCYILIFLS